MICAGQPSRSHKSDISTSAARESLERQNGSCTMPPSFVEGVLYYRQTRHATKEQQQAEPSPRHGHFQAFMSSNALNDQSNRHARPMTSFRLHHNRRIGFLLKDLPLFRLLDHLLLRFFVPHELARAAGLTIRLRLRNLAASELLRRAGGEVGLRR